MQGQTIRKKVIENGRKGTMHVHLLTELTGNLYSEESEWEEEWSESDEYGMPLDGTELADYEEVIREELERYGEDDLMQYFDGSESIQEKIQSAVVTIENKDGILYGCTKLELNEFLSQEELQEFTEYITGQYSDGWGEGFEQRDIKVDGGTMNVHFGILIWNSRKCMKRKQSRFRQSLRNNVPSYSSLDMMGIFFHYGRCLNSFEKE